MVERELQRPIPYKGHVLTMSLRIDLIVDGLVVGECKSTSKDNDIFEDQSLPDLRLTGLKLGLVINFGEKLVRDGVHRIMNGL